jgi:hypothetical protein
MNPLQQILREGLVTSARSTKMLRGGLYLVFYPREADTARLVAVRQHVAPSDTELQVLRREMTAVLGETTATIGEFKQLPPLGDWHGAEVWISFQPVQAEMPIPKETRYE